MGLVRIAIVGSGPSGLYLGKYLHKLANSSKANAVRSNLISENASSTQRGDFEGLRLQIDYIERKDTLLGHFNYGLAPDKLSLKVNSFKLLNNEFRYFTNVNVVAESSRAKGVRLEVLKKFYNYIVLCVGCDSPKSVRLKNESLGVFDSLEVAKFYNRRFLRNFNYFDYLAENHIPIYFNPNNHLSNNYFSNNNFSNSNSEDNHSSNSYLTNNYSGNNNLKYNHTIDNNWKDNWENNLGFEKGVFEAYLEKLKERKRINVGVIGGGNVSLDILRIFGQNRKSLENLRVDPVFSDFVEKSEIANIFVYVRSNLATNKFSNSELNDLLSLTNNYNNLNNNNHNNNNLDKDNNVNNNLDNNKKDKRSRSVRFLILGDDIGKHLSCEEVRASRKLSRKLQIFQKLVNQNNFNNSGNFENKEKDPDNSQSEQNNPLNVHFRFNCRVDGVVNGPHGIQFVEYSQSNSNNNYFNNINKDNNNLNKDRDNNNLDTININNINNNIKDKDKFDKEAGRDPVDLLVKCVGSESSVENSALLRNVDCKRVFLLGWAGKKCSGNLTETLSDSLAFAHRLFDSIVYNQRHNLNYNHRKPNFVKFFL